jgi:monovalent cation:H+ antiporter-2, CPA2 family
VVKGLVFAGTVRTFGYGNIIPFAVGLGLFQVGEFSFVIARVGLDAGAITQRSYSVMLTTAVVTMALTPFAMRLAPLLYGRWRERYSKEAMSTFNLPETGLRDHVVITGYGRVGSFVARLLARLEQPFAVVDSNPGRGDEARGSGYPVVYGDAGAEPVLEAAGVRRARLVIVTVPDPVGARLVVTRVRALNPNVHVVARTATVEQLEELGRLGVYEAVHPESEAGLELGRQALSHLGVAAGDVQRFADEVRRELYAPITRQGTDGDLLAQLGRASRQIETEWVRLPEGSPLGGRTIGELGVRTKSGASIVAIVRDDLVLANPGPDARFEPGDLVGVLGSPEQRAAFVALT